MIALPAPGTIVVILEPIGNLLSDYFAGMTDAEGISMISIAIAALLFILLERLFSLQQRPACLS